MSNQRRNEWKIKIREAKQELKTAGPRHRRDLMKHIHRMQKELMIYDKYQQAAKSARG
jgi:hypothetical protein